jgi:DNA-binding response OmpR family regulator
MDVLLACGGRRALVVEDEYLIGSDLVEQLEALGFETEGPFPSCAEASAWLASNTPDLAVLDILLRDGDCLELARELRRRNVPILFYTGLLDWAPLHGEFAGAHVLRKPVRPADLARALSQLLDGAIASHIPTL